jgi:hypothetical protein
LVKWLSSDNRQIEQAADSLDYLVDSFLGCRAEVFAKVEVETGDGGEPGFGLTVINHARESHDFRRLNRVTETRTRQLDCPWIIQRQQQSTLPILRRIRIKKNHPLAPHQQFGMLRTKLIEINHLDANQIHLPQAPRRNPTRTIIATEIVAPTEDEGIRGSGFRVRETEI